jgi:hypothetical protein
MSNAKSCRDVGPQATNDRGGQPELSTVSKQQQSLSVAIQHFGSNTIRDRARFQGPAYQRGWIQLSNLDPDMGILQLKLWKPSSELSF